MRGEEEEAGTGVDWLEAGDRRPRPWPETEEEKDDNGSRAGKWEEEEEEERKGVGFRVPQLIYFAPFFLFFSFNSTTKLQPIVLIIEYSDL